MPGLFDRIKDTTTFSGLLTVGTSFVVDNNPAPIYQTFRNRYSINDTNISVAITSQTSSNWMVCWCTYTNVDTLRVDEIIFTSNTSTPDAPVTFSGTSDVFVTASSRAVAGLREANTFTGNNYFTTGNVGIGTAAPASKLVVSAAQYNTNQDAAYLVAGTTSYTGATTNWGTYGFAHKLKSTAGGVARVALDAITAGGLTEIFCADTSGNFGIGTPSPNRKLTVSAGGPDARINILDSDTTAPAALAVIEFSGSDARGGYVGINSGSVVLQSEAALSNGILFSANGAERMRITNTGNVGIGTTPSERLSVFTGASEFAVEWSGPGKSWVLGSAAGRAYIRNKTDSVEAISILNDGKVGIGTPSPSSKLTVSDGTVRIDLLPYIGTTGYIGTQSNHPLGIITNNAEAIRVTTSGNVGIGTTSPSSPLVVSTGTANFDAYLGVNGTISIGNAQASGIVSPGIIGVSVERAGLRLVGRTADANTDGDIVFDVRPTTGGDFATVTTKAYRFTRYGSELMTILRNGNVGIGLTSLAPNTALHIRRDTEPTNEARAIVQAVDQRIVLGARWVSGVEQYSYIASNSDSGAPTDFRIRTATTDRLTVLAANGNVGIGTTSPSALLTIDDNAASGTGLVLTGGGSGQNLASFIRDVGSNAAVKINASGGDPQIVFESSFNTFTIGTDGNDFKISDDPVLGNTDRLTINSSGNVGIGTASPLARLHVSGGDVRLDNNRALRFADTAGTGSVALLLQNDNNFVAYNPSGVPVFSFQTGANPVAAYGANANNRMFLDASLNYMTFITNGIEQLRINNIGDVGIGTTGPESRLHSAGTVTIRQGNLAYLRLVVGAGQDNSGYIETRVGAGSTTLPAGSRVGFSGWYNGAQFYAAWTDVAVPMVFGTNGTDRLKLEALGGVNVFGDFGVSGNYYVKGTNTIYGNPSGDTYGNFRVLQSVVQTDGMFINYNSAGTTTNAIRFYTPGITERMRITNTGSVAIGTSGGDYGRDWRLVVRQDHNSDTQVGIINATSGTAANARLTHIVGTANGFVDRVLYDGNGAPFFRNEYGAAINYEVWMFNGTSRMLLDNRGVLRLVNDQGPASGDTLALGFRGSPNNDRTASTYTFELTDAGKTVRKANTTVQTWTIPLESSVNFPVGTCIMICNVQWSGNLTIARASGVNLIFRSGTSNLNANRIIAGGGGSATIRKVSGDIWTITGVGIS